MIVQPSGQQIYQPYGGRAHTATSSGVLYVYVQSARNATGSYALTVTIPEDDHGNAASTATEVEALFTTAGEIEYSGDIDYFSFSVQAGTTYVVAAAGGTPGSFFAGFFTLEGRQIYEQYGSTYTATTSGVIYVQVRNQSGATGAYTVGIFELPVAV